jgi:hypothetical protein
MDVRVHPHFVAALAAEGHGWRIACWQWHDQGRCDAGCADNDALPWGFTR